jgi:hypothetical protein
MRQMEFEPPSFTRSGPPRTSEDVILMSLALCPEFDRGKKYDNSNCDCAGSRKLGVKEFEISSLRCEIRGEVLLRPQDESS